MTAPIPTLHIQRIHSGIYEWRITLGGGVLDHGEGLISIAACVEQALHGFSDETHAIEIRYRSVGMGTFPIHALLAMPTVYADKIVALFSAAMGDSI